MIFNILYCAIFALILINCNGHSVQNAISAEQYQSGDTFPPDSESISNQETIIYDDEKHPLMLVQDSNVIKYYMLDGTAIDVSSLGIIHYTDSIKDLQWKVMKSIYNDGEDEYHSRELVYILFDSKLVIREIRFLNIHPNKPYKQKLIKAIKSTEKCWHSDYKSDWYLYRYVQKII